MQTSAFTIIELSGHIIDSLTLAKVIDKIQAMDCQYQINDIQIGQKKNDFSYAQISVWTETEAGLNALLDELQPYGAQPVKASPVQLQPASQDGMLPHGFYGRLNPPTQVLYAGQWIPVEREGADLAVVVDQATQTARFKKASEIKQGELVVTGKAGVKILPMLGENANALA